MVIFCSDTYCRCPSTHLHTYTAAATIQSRCKRETSMTHENFGWSFVDSHNSMSSIKVESIDAS